MRRKKMKSNENATEKIKKDFEVIMGSIRNVKQGELERRNQHENRARESQKAKREINYLGMEENKLCSDKKNELPNIAKRRNK